MNIEGAVVVDRALARHEVWDAPMNRPPSEPFCKRAAWVDLLLLANTADGSFTKRGQDVTLARGQVGWSKKGLADRWGWSITKVTGWLAWLEQRGMVRVETVDKLTTRILLVNYDLYQGIMGLSGNAEEQRKENGNTTGVTPGESGEKTERNREGIGEGEGVQKTPRGEGEGVRAHEGGCAEFPSAEEVRTWAGMAGVDPAWAEGRAAYLTETNGWLRHGRLVNWRSMFQRWWNENRVDGAGEFEKTSAPENGRRVGPPSFGPGKACDYGKLVEALKEGEK